MSNAYKPCFKRLERTEKTVKTWSEDAVSSLQGCLECTDWEGFFSDAGNDIDKVSVSSYVAFGVDSIIPTKKVIIYLNNKPWATKNLKSGINKKKIIFYSGDPLEKQIVSREVKKK